MLTNHGILESIVYHKRHSPVSYSFSHKFFFLLLNLNQLKFLNKTRLFSTNKFNLFSIFWQDYGFEDFTDPAEYIKKINSKFGIPNHLIGDIVLLTMPKLLGYVFNPVSFWLCFNKKGHLFSVLAEVHNTFGERHGYLCFHENFSAIKSKDIVNCNKIFHVSPFFDVKGSYDFSFDITEKEININIQYKMSDQSLLSTSIRGKIDCFSDKNLIKFFSFYPLMTLKVIFLIHYHALMLWIRKAPYFKKPNKPNIEIT